MQAEIRKRLIKKHWQLYLLLFVPVSYTLIFHYYPMYGVQIAFRDFVSVLGITKSPWVGLRNLQLFIESPQFGRLISNTLGISFYGLIAGFPMPILLALALNNIGSRGYRKAVQLVTYAPYFISTVVMASLVLQILHPTFGAVNAIIRMFDGNPINFMAIPGLFKTIYVWSGIWQYTGYAAVIYIAALAGIDPSLHEAATVDGATRLQRIIHIELPGIMPTATIMLILNVGRVMNVEFEKIFLLQNQLNMRTADVIATYVYRIGLVSGQFSYSAAIGLFNSVINLILLVSVNQVIKKLGATSLW